MKKGKYSDMKKNANYDEIERVEPMKRMGSGQFANMPESPMLMKFSDDHGYRDGIINDFSCSVEYVSGIAENHKRK